MKKFVSVFALMRPSHWIKNLFVFLPLFFNGSMGNLSALKNTSFVFIAFCFVASSIYCLNDIRDVEADRNHETKCHRPIASGAISVPLAIFIMIFLLILSVLSLLPLIMQTTGETSTFLRTLLVLLLYYALNLAYCLGLKHIAVLDVMILSAGYVLRLVGGSVASKIPLTHWIVIMTYLLSLFLALAKRRDDVLIMNRTGTPPRKNTMRYSLEFINQLLTLNTAMTLFCYIMYTVQDEVMSRFGTRHVYVTALFVLAGFMRYLQLSLVDEKSGAPEKLAVHDSVLRLILVLWIFSFVLIIYAPRVVAWIGSLI